MPPEMRHCQPCSSQSLARLTDHSRHTFEAYFSMSSSLSDSRRLDYVLQRHPSSPPRRARFQSKAEKSRPFFSLVQCKPHHIPRSPSILLMRSRTAFPTASGSPVDSGTPTPASGTDRPTRDQMEAREAFRAKPLYCFCRQPHNFVVVLTIGIMVALHVVRPWRMFDRTMAASSGSMPRGACNLKG